MRRVLAISVLLLNALSLLAPVAFAATAGSSPACCRRNGNHHCMSGKSAMSVSNDAVPVFRAFPSCCPCRSQTATPTLVSRVEVSRTGTPYSPSEILLVKTESASLSSHIHPNESLRGPPGENLQS